MKKLNATIIIVTIIAIFFTGCSTKNKQASTSEKSQVIYTDANEQAQDMEDIDSEEHPPKEVERITDQHLDIDAKKINEDNYNIINELPEQMIFSNVQLPNNFTIQDVVIKKNCGIEWNYSSYACSLQLLIGDKKQAVFSFGSAYNGEDDESILIDSKYNVQSGYLGWDEYIILVSYDENLGEICFDCTDYFNEKTNDYKFENYNDASNFKVISAGMTSLYLIYDKENTKFIDTYSYGKDGITFVKRQQFKDDVVEIYESESTIFVEYENKDNRYIAICNRDFAVLDVIQVDIKIEIDSLKYIFTQDKEEKCELKLYIKRDNKLYEVDIPINNNYSKLYTYTVLVDQNHDYNKKYEHHYIINDDRIFYREDITENGKLLDNNYRGINYFMLGNGDIVKSNSEHDVCYILEEPYNGVVKFINIDDYYVGLNVRDEICYIDEEYKDRVINMDYLGEKMSFNNVIFDSINETITYINKEEKAIYTINKEGNKKLNIIIPDNILEALYKENEFDYLKMGYDEKGIGIIGNRILYYYDCTDKEWITVETDQWLRYNPDYGYTYNDIDCPYIFDVDKHIFRPYYINKPETYTSMIVEDILYVNIYSEYDDVIKDKNHKALESEYVPLETSNGKYLLSDYKMTDEHKVFKEYKTNLIYNSVGVRWNNIISEPVRCYSISDKGVLYTGFEEKAYLYYYDFNTKRTMTLYDDSYVSDLELIGNYGYFRTVDNHVLNKVNLENKLIESLEVEESRLQFQASDNYIAINTQENNKINIIDVNKFEIIDTIEGSGSKWNNDNLFCDCNGYLVKYNPLRKESIIMANITYPAIQGIHKNSIYYLLCYDGPAPLEMISLDEVYEFDNGNNDSNMEVDYYLLYSETDYYSYLLIYDNKKKKLRTIGEADNIIYEVNENIIRFREDSYEKEGDWQEIIVQEGAKIKVNPSIF
jgi:hypothetical protein